MNDDELKEAFWASRVPAAEWTHAAHLRMAWLTLEGASLDEAHILMRVGIIRLNVSHGLVETPARGYHETLTRVWLALVAAAKNVERGASSEQFLAFHPALTRDAPLRHYSRGRLYSVEARARFVEPDLDPLPLR